MPRIERVPMLPQRTVSWQNLSLAPYVTYNDLEFTTKLLLILLGRSQSALRLGGETSAKGIVKRIKWGFWPLLRESARLEV